MSRLNLIKSLFGLAAGISFLLSTYLWFTGERTEAMFTALWVPSILSLGAMLISGTRTGR